MIPIYHTLIVLLILAYILIMVNYIYHWRALKIWDTSSDFIPSTKITVIIPVRNEAENILACLNSILKQNYPSHLLEAIVVDDHSTDETLQILRSLKDPCLRILELSNFIDASKTRAFKKQAIQIAIDQSEGDLILTTDGDCIVPANWLQRMVHFYESNKLKFVAAPVNFYEEKNLLENFQSLDFTGMMGVTGAGIEGRFMNMCNGANLAYDKKVFYEVGGFTGINHLASGDDMLLMQKIARKYPDKIGYLKNVEATVKTKAQDSWNAFFNQRLRWASKSSDYKEWKVTAMLGLVWAFCWSIVISFFGILFFGKWMLWLFLIQFGIKTILDFIFLGEMTRFFNRSDLMKYFFQSQVLHILYIVIVGTASIFIKKYNWKGRKTQ